MKQLSILLYKSFLNKLSKRTAKTSNVFSKKRSLLGQSKIYSHFSEHHYLLEFNLAQPKHAERWVQGFLKVNLYGAQSEVTDVDLTPE